MVIQSRTGGHASAALRRRVLHLTHIALSPSARSSLRRGTVTAGALRLLAAFPRTGGPLLVLTLDGRHIRAPGDDALDDAQRASRLPALPAPPVRPAAARARAGNEGRPRGAAACRSPAQLPRSSRSTAQPATGTASTGGSLLPSTGSRRTSAATRTRRRGCRRLDAVPAEHVAALGRRRVRRRRRRSVRTPRMRSTAPRATSTPRARAA